MYTADDALYWVDLNATGLNTLIELIANAENRSLGNVEQGDSLKNILGHLADQFTAMGIEVRAKLGADAIDHVDKVLAAVTVAQDKLEEARLAIVDCKGELDGAMTLTQGMKGS